MVKKNYEELVVTLQILQLDDIITTSPASGEVDNDGVFRESWN